MKGKIEIVVKNHSVTIDGDLEDVSQSGKLMVFDALADTLELDERERRIIGIAIYGGGVDVLMENPGAKIKIPREMTDVIKEFKRRRMNKNETDAL
jgi:hypothetical protein